MVSSKDLKDIANIMRRDVLEMTTKAGSGHPTSCMSCAEIISCLFFGHMKYDITITLRGENHKEGPWISFSQESQEPKNE